MRENRKYPPGTTLHEILVPDPPGPSLGTDVLWGGLWVEAPLLNVSWCSLLSAVSLRVFVTLKKLIRLFKSLFFNKGKMYLVARASKTQFKVFPNRQKKGEVQKKEKNSSITNSFVNNYGFTSSSPQRV